MKKLIAILLSCILGTTLLIGCSSNQKELDKQQDELIQNLKGKDGEIRKLTEGKIYNTVAGVAPNSNSYYILNKDKEYNRDQSVVIELNVDRSNKEKEVKEFVDKTIKVTEYLEEDLSLYTNLVILMYVDGKFTGNSIIYKISDYKLEHKDTKISEDYWDAFQKVKNDK